MCIQIEKKNYYIKLLSTSLAEKLSKNGIVSYGNIIDISSKIINDYPSILDITSNRLQFIFIDEYQDSRICIHQIFQKVLSIGSTIITIIGDPLQAIFEFAYIRSIIREETRSQPNSFAETPMVLCSAKFRNGVDKILTENRRSSTNIVNLLNKHINSEHEQKAINGDNGIPVYFIKKIKFSEIYGTYVQLKDQNEID